MDGICVNLVKLGTNKFYYLISLCLDFRSRSLMSLYEHPVFELLYQINNQDFEVSVQNVMVP